MNTHHQLAAGLCALASCASAMAQSTPLSLNQGLIFATVPQPNTLSIVSTVSMVDAKAGLALSNGEINPFQPRGMTTSGPSQAVEALNVSKATVTGTDSTPAVSTLSTYGGRLKVTERYTQTLLPTVSSVSVDQNTGALLGAQLNGTFTVSAPQTPGVLAGGTFSLSDLRINLAEGYITADLVSAPLAGPTVSSDDLMLFRIGSQQGISSLEFGALRSTTDLTAAGSLLSERGWSVVPQTLPTSSSLALTGWLELADLKMTDGALQLFTQGLDIAVGGTAYNAFNALTTRDGESWGALRLGLGVHVHSGYPGPTLTVPATLDPAQMLQPVTAVVPEPSSYALMLVGLAGIGAAARRKHLHSLAQ